MDFKGGMNFQKVELYLAKSNWLKGGKTFVVSTRLAPLIEEHEMLILDRDNGCMDIQLRNEVGKCGIP